MREHQGFINNYNQQKAIYSITKDSYYDCDFYILKESYEFISPISVIYYEEYESVSHLESRIKTFSENIQCTISTGFPNSICPGTGQYPELWDYPDDIDTVKFLMSF